MTGTLVHRATRLTIALLLTGLGACTAAPPIAEPVNEPAPVVPDPQPPSQPVVSTEPKPESVPLWVPPARVPSNVAVVLSSRRPAYEEVAEQLSPQLERYSIYNLADKSQPPVTVFRQIRDNGDDAVVAIGLRAAISAVAMSDVPVIFCQVFNYREHDLVTENSRGISALPPLERQIAAWKQVDPNLKNIGAILGEGHEDLIAEAQAAAAEHDIDLQIRTVRSDRETQYVFNRLVSEIDGFWLFPDNRVLSNSVLKHILTLSARRRVQVAVFNESLLEMGAALSSSTVESDIAQSIAVVLQRIEAGDLKQLPDVSPLSDVRVVTNQKVLEPMLALGQDEDDGTTAQVAN